MCMVGLKAFNSYSKQIQLPSGFTMVVLGPNLVTHLDFIMGDVEKCCIGNFYHFVLHNYYLRIFLYYKRGKNKRVDHLGYKFNYNGISIDKHIILLMVIQVALGCPARYFL